MSDATGESGDGAEGEGDKSSETGLIAFAVVDKELMKRPQYSRHADEYDVIRKIILFIKGIRQESGLSRAALARRLNISQAKLVELERGKMKQEFSLYMLQRIALVCGKKFVLSWD